MGINVSTFTDMTWGYIKKSNRYIITWYIACLEQKPLEGHAMGISKRSGLHSQLVQVYLYRDLVYQLWKREDHNMNTSPLQKWPVSALIPPSQPLPSII